DFFGQSIFLKYGETLYEEFYDTVITNDPTNLCNISCKGKTEGAEIFVGGTSNFTGGSLLIQVDGNSLAGLGFGAPDIPTSIIAEQTLIKYKYYDSINKRYVFLIAKDITFSNNFRIIFHDGSAVNDCLIYSCTFYSKVTA
ncbi:MAG: hypothetical protein PHH73_04815, partial [Candidatus Rickettsiella isopodorum]|nr:hypothetical protein [Candidatus Rickettsiella isopodorum]